MMRVTVRSAAVAMVAVSGLLAGCAGEQAKVETKSPVVAEPTGKPTGIKVGRPYRIKGHWYTPKVDWDYREEGYASWYGRKFHGRKTASGERYNMNKMTAAHKTLPLPTMVRVTNLENGRKLDLRVNDRGPFSKGRIIDVSKAAAHRLGFRNKGVARVRVEILREESLRLAGLAPNGKPISKAKSAAPPLQVAKAKPKPESTRKPGSTVVARAAPSARLQAAEAVPAVYVQAGAFRHYGNAARARDQLERLGPVQVIPAHMDARHVYRVRVGPVPSRTEAERLMFELAMAGYPGSHVVVD